MSLLNAAHLVEVEENPAPIPENEEFTIPAAVDRIRRIRFHRERITSIDANVAAMFAPLVAEVARIQAWGEGEKERPLASITYHESWLSAYYRANPPKKGKTVSFPGGSVSSRDQKPTWTYPADDVLIAAVKGARPDLVTTHTEEVVNRTDLKRHAEVIGGKVFLTTAEGAEVELPIAVTEQPAKITVELEEIANA